MWRKSNPFQTYTGRVIRLAACLLILSQVCNVTRIAAQEPSAEKAPAPAEPPKQEPPKQEPPGDAATKPAVSEPEKPAADKPAPAPDKADDKKPDEKKPEEKPKPAEKREETPKSPDSRPSERRAAQAPTNNANERLDKIEKQLEEIGSFLKSMKQVPAAETAKGPASTSVNAQATKAPWSGQISSEWLKGIRWRGIGPANMGGRITDLAINEADPSTWWAATGGGGLIKTTNNGISFEHQFDKEATVSIGSIAVSKTDPKIVWVGTGENNPRNSVSYGDGVYKSIDGGKTWKNMGLKQSFQIGEIVIHPTDPNIVYVGALGRLYGNNEERGLYKTTDGGATWERCFYIDDRTGVIDLQLHPTDPNTIIVAAWERLRDGFDSWPGSEVPLPEGYDGYDPIRKWGPGSGLYKSTDAGKSWKKLTAGLPTSQLGRIGFDWYRKDPNILYAVVDCENIGKGPAPLAVQWGGVAKDVNGKAIISQVYPKSPASRGGLMVGDVVESIGDKPITTFDEIITELRSKKAGDKLSVNIARGEEKKTLEFLLTARSNRSRGFQPGVWFGGLGSDEDSGVRLIQVSSDGPAAKAGLLSGDLITEFDCKPTDSWDAIVEWVASKKAGDKVKVKLTRDEEAKELEMTLEDRVIPPGMPTPATVPDAYLGVQGDDVPEGKGAKLTQITAGGPAEKAGLMAGDVLQELDGKPLKNYRGINEVLKDKKVGDKLTIKFARATEVKEMEVELGSRPAPIRPYTSNLGGQAQNVQDQQGSKGFEYGGIYKSTDCGESWTRVNSVHSRPMYFSVVRVDPNNEQAVYLLGVSQYKSLDGGVTFDANFGRDVHADGHALWIDPRDGKHMIVGVDGGVYHTYDQGKKWDHLNTMALGQFYHVAISPKYPYYVYGGLQDNGTWGGPAFSLDGSGPVNEDWLSVGGGDGFMCRVDPNDPDLVYSTSQGGAMNRRNMKTGERASIRPAQPPEGQPQYRFNWNTPFILSNANSRVFYAGGNYVFRSLDRGNNLEKISPEITLTKRGSATALSESPLNANVLYAGTDDGALWVTKDGGKEWQEIGKNMNLPAPRWVATIEASRYAEGRVYVALDGHRSNDDDPYAFVSEDFGKTWKSIRSNLPWGSTRCLRESPFNENVLLVGTEFAVFASANRGGYWNSLNTNLPTVPVFDFAFHPNNGEVVAATHGRSLWIADLTPLNQLNSAHLSETAALYRSAPTIRWKRDPARGGTNRQFSGSNPSAGASIYYALPKKASEVSVKIMDASGQTVRELRGSGEAGLQRVSWDLVLAPPQNGGRGGSRGGSNPPSAASSSANAPSGNVAAPEQGTPQQGGPAGGRGFGRRRSESSEGTATASLGAPTASAATPANVGESGAPASADVGEGTPQRSEAGPTGFGGGQGGGPGGRGRVRTAPSGSYRVVLTVDGKEFSQELRLLTDPNLPALNDLLGAEQEYELWQGDDEPFDRDLKNAIKQSQAWARMYEDN
ncbi:MAG: PDZ domain-containing protein [Pirellulaceae bacterium]|nr:PDZ domain-containing protein [Pirellulaceae bacterium]